MANPKSNPKRITRRSTTIEEMRDLAHVPSINVDDAKKELRALYNAVWLLDLHANLLTAAREGTLPREISAETIHWHSGEVCSEQTSIIMETLDNLCGAIGIGTPFEEGGQHVRGAFA